MMTPGALGLLRSIQEGALTETVLVEQLGERALDESTGKHTRSRAKVWEGRGSVVSSSSTEVDSAGRLLVKTELKVSLPVDGTGAVKPGHHVTVKESVTVPELAGMVVRLTGKSLGGWRTLRRFPAQEVPENER